MIWEYILAISADDLIVAETLADQLGNPGGIENNFLKFPRTITDRGYQYDSPIEWYISSFVAYNLISEGSPSREQLDNLSGNIPGILWWRSLNPYLPDSDGQFVIVDKHADAGGLVGDEWSLGQAAESLLIG